MEQDIFPLAGPTPGQVAMRVTFNPSKRGDIDQVKLAYANLYDLLRHVMSEHIEQVSEAHRGFAQRDLSIAITELENSQMRAVKAITW